MLNLILAVMAIALTAATVAGSILYLNPTRPLTELTYQLTKNGLTSLAKAEEEYRVANGGLKPDVDTWQAQLTPTYLFLPAPPGGTVWAYSDPAQPTAPRYFCIYGAAVSEPQYAGFAKYGREASAQQYFMSTACGATTNAAKPTTFPAAWAITYWIDPPI